MYKRSSIGRDEMHLTEKNKKKHPGTDIYGTKM